MCAKHKLYVTHRAQGNQDKDPHPHMQYNNDDHAFFLRIKLTHVFLFAWAYFFSFTL